MVTTVGSGGYLIFYGFSSFFLNFLFKSIFTILYMNDNHQTVVGVKLCLIL